MRRIAFSLLLLGITGCGLLSADRHCGCEFHWILPPTVSAQSLVTTGAPPVGLTGVGGVPIAAAARPTPALAVSAPSECGPMLPSPVARMTANDPCNLEDVCKRLDVIERRTAPTLPIPRPMPKGDPQ